MSFTPTLTSDDEVILVFLKDIFHDISDTAGIEIGFEVINYHGRSEGVSFINVSGSKNSLYYSGKRRVFFFFIARRFNGSPGEFNLSEKQKAFIPKQIISGMEHVAYVKTGGCLLNANCDGNDREGKSFRSGFKG